jgi:WS/DGAT/MGAT family acyltransferase
MIKLGLMDHLFYKLDESGMVPMIMQGASVLDPSEAGHRLDGDALAEHLAARLWKIPLLRQKLVRDPLGIGNLRLVEDPKFDIREHISRATLRSPGDEDALLTHLEKFSVQRLDLGKPLWRFEVIDGLAGDRLAVASKLHHCILDGVGGVQTLGSLYDSESLPPERLARAPRRPNLREPSRLNLMGRALGDVASQLIAGPRFLSRNSGALLRVLGSALRERLQTGGGASAAKTSLNAKLSKDRRVVAFRRFDLQELKALTRALDCTINDVALLLCSAAFDHYFTDVGEHLTTDLLAAMPISVRKENDTTTGNALGAAIVNLHTRIPRLTDRLRAIQRDARVAKEQIRPTDAPSIDLNEALEMFSPLMVDALTAVGSRLASWDVVMDRFVFANTVISNVPGPREALYIAGARVEYSIPMIPMGDIITLSWGVTSFGRWLTIGFHGCGEAVRDKELLIQGLDKAYAELRAYAGSE